MRREGAGPRQRFDDLEIRGRGHFLKCVLPQRPFLVTAPHLFFLTKMQNDLLARES